MGEIYMYRDGAGRIGLELADRLLQTLNHYSPVGNR